MIKTKVFTYFINDIITDYMKNHLKIKSEIYFGKDKKLESYQAYVVKQKGFYLIMLPNIEDIEIDPALVFHEIRHIWQMENRILFDIPFFIFWKKIPFPAFTRIWSFMPWERDAQKFAIDFCNELVNKGIVSEV